MKRIAEACDANMPRSSVHRHPDGSFGTVFPVNNVSEREEHDSEAGDNNIPSN